MSWFPHCPEPPHWRVDWPAIEQAFGWVGELAGCPQDPLHHAEGDVATHTRLACEALTGLLAYRARPPEDRTLLFAAVLLHDVAKPACTRQEPDGRITARAHARFLYFRTPGRDPDYAAYDDTACEVVLLSGLPGVGKDHWLREPLPDLPVVSLDALRAELRVDPTDPQQPVVEAARERAKAYLRRGQGFAWNGTNLSREVRDRCTSLFAAYNARVRIVYLEVSEARLLRQNRARPAPVPEAVIDRLMARWEVPDRTEGHRVDWIRD
ncbi:MAG: AAA family ATPase [Chloroflexi bacterium]|nr:AAA family ATPase [Chloroflexota bacterium]